MPTRHIAVRGGAAAAGVEGTRNYMGVKSPAIDFAISAELKYPPELAEGLQEFVQPGDMARIAQPIDWLGLNHYCPIYARADQGPLGFAWADAPTDGPLTGVGWRIDPRS